MYVPLDAHSESVLRRRKAIRAAAGALAVIAVVLVGVLAATHKDGPQAWAHEKAYAVIRVFGGRSWPQPKEIADGLTPKVSDLAKLMLGAMNVSHDPCDDFYQYACGGFSNTFELPKGFDEWWMNENVVEKRIRKQLTEILNDNWPVLTEYFKSCMDTQTIDKLGASPLAPLFEKIDAINDLNSIMSLAGELHSIGVPVFFDMLVTPDPKDPNKYLLQIGQGGIATGDPNMYDDEDGEERWWNSASDAGSDGAARAASSDSDSGAGSGPGAKAKRLAKRRGVGIGRGAPAPRPRSYAAIKEAEGDHVFELYQKHVSKMMMYSYKGSSKSSSEVRAAAERAIAVESRIAKAWGGDDVDNEDPVKAYHRLNMDGLKARAPDIPWETFFASAGNDKAKDIESDTPKYLDKLNRIISRAKAEEVKAYFRWYVVHSYAQFMAKEIAEEDWWFFQHVLDGSEKMQSRDFLCVQFADSEIGQLLGHYWVMKHFGEEQKAGATSIVARIKENFLKHVDEVKWMDEFTIGVAKQKLANMQNMIGYPERWPTFDALHITADALVESTMKVRKFQYVDFIRQVGKAADLNRWTMTPPTVNAYYDPTNIMVIPAGQLQNPDFDAEYPPSAQFGVTGMTVGHEVTHGYDEEGSLYDAEGRLAHWMPKKVAAAYRKQQKCVIDLYNKAEVIPGLYVDGANTLGENVADWGGLQLTYWAYLDAAAEAASRGTPGFSGPDGPSIFKGLTDEQFFFVSYGQQWCFASTAAHFRTLVRDNPHSPPPVRCNVPLGGFQAFQNAFNCPAASKMNRVADRCPVWW
eukprot:tig00000655_g2879.t1